MRGTRLEGLRPDGHPGGALVTSPATRMLSARYRFALSTLPFAALVSALACSSSSKGKAEGPHEDWAGESRDTEIKHEVCDPKGKEARVFKGESDLASGKSYVTRVYVSS